MSVTCAILCGGQGTRLRPVIGDSPKCVALVGGRPFLTYILDHLDSQGVKKVVLCVRRGQSLIDMSIGGQYLDIEVKYSWEDTPLGTGGALKNALPLLDTDPVLVLNGDTYCPFRLQPMLDEHLGFGWEGTILKNRFGNVGVRLVSHRLIGFIKEGINLDEWMCFFIKGIVNDRLCGFPFVDIGTPEGYLRAESFLREQGAIQ